MLAFPGADLAAGLVAVFAGHVEIALEIVSLGSVTRRRKDLPESKSRSHEAEQTPSPYTQRHQALIPLSDFPILASQRFIAASYPNSLGTFTSQSRSSNASNSVHISLPPPPPSSRRHSNSTHTDTIPVPLNAEPDLNPRNSQHAAGKPSHRYASVACSIFFPFPVILHHPSIRFHSMQRRKRSKC